MDVICAVYVKRHIHLCEDESFGMKLCIFIQLFWAVLVAFVQQE